MVKIIDGGPEGTIYEGDALARRVEHEHYKHPTLECSCSSAEAKEV